MAADPRIGPGGIRDIGLVNDAVARVAGVAIGGERPNIFTTLGRHRRLFRRWLRFAGALMPGGVLPRAETELVILRVAENADSEYEWRHHERLAEQAGLSREEVLRVRDRSSAEGWAPRQALLLRAADELHLERTISDGLWAELRPRFSDRELIELCMLVGHYEMLAMTLNALRVEPDSPPDGPPSRLTRWVRRFAARRRAEN